ncbi:carbohydrate-binding protein [Flavobacterium sp. J27]|uniref:carbohydrate-binding protein n=1 Tax=Flavobacterium sp. J27 TaxID=2060419 RepID=UPI00102F5711|nr:carbohydrate-binding protein [Flavobacterium sp. J27]
MNLKHIHLLKKEYIILFFILFIFSCEKEEDRTVTLYAKGNTEAQVSSTNIDFGETINFTSTSFKALTINWTFEGGSPTTSINPNIAVTYNTPGTFEAKLVVKYIDNTIETKQFTIVVNGIDPPLPFSGIPVDVEGTFEAENYDLGGEGIGYHDTEMENLAVTNGSPTYRSDDGMDIEVGSTVTNISYTNDGEWANYTVNVTNSGTYDFEFIVASGDPSGGKSIKLQLLNPDTGVPTDLGQTGDFPNTGGSSVYVSKMVTGISLNEGINTLRLYFTGANTNLDKVNVIASLPPAPIDGLGIYTERDITNSNPGIVPPVNNGNMSITTVTNNPNHGNSSLFYHYDPTGNGNPQSGFGLSHMDLTVAPYNASAYNYLHIAVRSNTAKNVRIRFNTSSGNYWITLKPSAPTYGMLWDGAWHELVIPLSDMLANGNGAGLSTVAGAISTLRQFTIRTDDSDYTTNPNSFDYYIDDIYLTTN